MSAAVFFCLAVLPAATRAQAVGPLFLRPRQPMEEYADRVRVTSVHYTVKSTIGPVDTPLPLDFTNYLLDHPDLTAFIVRRHRIAPYVVEMRSPREAWADDGAGTKGLIALVERSEDSRLYYGDGIHQRRLMPDVKATAVIAMKAREESGADCRPHVKSLFEVEVKVKNPVLSTLIKALGPFIRQTVVRIFMRAFLAANKVGVLAVEDPDAVAQDVREFPGLSAEERAQGAVFLERLKAKSSCP